MPSAIKLSDIPWLPFHSIVDSLFDILGFRKTLQLRAVNRKSTSHLALNFLTTSGAFDHEILDILLSRVRIDVCFLRKRLKNTGCGTGYPEFTYIPHLFMSRLLFHRLQQRGLRDTPLVSRIKAITDFICNLDVGSEQCSRRIERYVCRAIMSRGETYDLRRAMFQDQEIYLSPGGIKGDAACIAAMLGDLKLLEHFALISVDFDMQAENRLFRRPLTLAAREGHEQACRYLIDHGANPNTVDPPLFEQRREFHNLDYGSYCRSYWDDALSAACRSGNLSLVRLLFEPTHNLQFSPNHHDVLAVAAESAQPEILAFLLQKAAFPLQINFIGSRILHRAARVGCTPIVAMMLDVEIDVDALEGSCNQWTALGEAVKGGHEETVRYLLSKGANVNYVGRDFSPLGLAVRYGHLNTVKTLLEHGADIDPKYRRHKGPLMEAACTQQIDMMQYLLQRGADLTS